MNRSAELPKEYRPYEELTVCSNHFRNAQMLLEVGGHAPVLIGAGPKPRLWISVPTSKDGKHWVSLVRDSKALHPKVEIKEQPDGTVVVVAAGHKVLQVHPKGDTVAEVSELDLRPLGLDVHGNAQALWVGSNQFSNNTFENVRAVIGIGP